MHDNLNQKKPTSFLQHTQRSLIIGSLSGLVEVACNHPLVTIRNAIQNNQLIIWRPDVLYQGVSTSLASIVGIVSLRIVSAETIAYYFFIVPQFRQGTLTERLTAGYAAGMVGALVAAPTEGIILWQQQLRSSFWTTLIIRRQQHHSWSFLTRGGLASAYRDGFNTMGFLTLVPLLKSYFFPALSSNMLVSLFSGCLVGSFVTLCSHPFDVIRNEQQKIPANQPVYSFTRTACLIYSERGAQGFFNDFHRVL